MAKLIFLASLIFAVVTNVSAHKLAVLPQAPPPTVNQKERTQITVSAATPTPIVTGFSSFIRGIRCVSSKLCYAASIGAVSEFDPTVTVATAAANLTRVTIPSPPPTGLKLRSFGVGTSGHGVVTGSEYNGESKLLYFYTLATPNELRSVTLPADVPFTYDATINTSPDGQRIFVYQYDDINSTAHEMTAVSVDGGLSYTVVPVVANLPSPSYYMGSFEIAMASDKVWFMSVRDSTDSSNAILKTVDGGNTFLALTVPNLERGSAAIRGIACADSGSTCYIASSSDDGRVLRTLDGGETWSTVFNVALPHGDLTYLGSLIVVGNTVAFLIKDDLVFSKDKGETWTRIARVAPAGCGPRIYELEIVASEDGKEPVAIFGSTNNTASSSLNDVVIFSLKL